MTTESVHRLLADDHDAQGPRPRIWGLGARQLHDAYWRARGVQCIRRGRTQRLDRSADVYLLLEPDHLVLFDLTEIVGRLAWNGTAVTRVSLSEARDRQYTERVICDESGRVKRVGRRYRARARRVRHALLTRQRSLARVWMQSTSRRDLWRRLRSCGAHGSVDRCRIAGRSFERGSVREERLLVDSLIERWPRPDQSIDGIAQIAPGVWVDDEDVAAVQMPMLGPVWLGRRNGERRPTCLIGPLWRADDRTLTPGRARRHRMMPIGAVQPAGDGAGRASRRSRRATYFAMKRAIDIIVSGLGLLLVLPIMILIAVAIVLDDGWPILFGQCRQMRGGGTFRCWKFRTMRRDADRIKREIAQYNEADGPQFFIKNDPRVTRVGRLLRVLHLDELPQLWNVLAGQMSLVGPRPSPDDENQLCPAWRELRLSVRPGITGLWQTRRTRQPGADFQEWIRYDMQYVEQAGILMDARILIDTAGLVIRRLMRYGA